MGDPGVRTDPSVEAHARLNYDQGGAEPNPAHAGQPLLECNLLRE